MYLDDSLSLINYISELQRAGSLRLRYLLKLEKFLWKFQEIDEIL